MSLELALPDTCISCKKEFKIFRKRKGEKRKDKGEGGEKEGG
jgi:hypothetical protein